MRDRKELIKELEQYDVEIIDDIISTVENYINEVEQDIIIVRDLLNSVDIDSIDNISMAESDLKRICDQLY